MRVIELMVEMHGVRQVTINGTDVDKGGTLHQVDEKVFRKQLSPDQQWRVLCEVRQLAARLEHAYRQGRLERGEISEDGKDLRSGARGIPGTGIGPLIRP